MSEYAKMIALKSAYVAAKQFLEEARDAGMTPRGTIEFLLDVGAEDTWLFHSLSVVVDEPEVVEHGPDDRFTEVDEAKPSLGQILRERLEAQRKQAL